MKFPLWRRRREEELEEEIRSHLEMAKRERLERGESAETAAESARREFGNVGLVKEVTRGVWGWGWLEQLGQDVRYGLWMLRRNPGFTFVAILTLTLGIGATTGIFSILNALLLQPLPYQFPDRLVMVWESSRKGDDQITASGLIFKDWVEQNQAFEVMAAFSNRTYILSGEDETEKVQGLAATASIFPLLGINPNYGNVFLPEDEDPSRNRVVILSHGLWQRRFGSDKGILGSAITINNLKYTVVGIMPPEFEFPLQSEKAELWVPLFLNLGRDNRGAHNYRVIARLKPEVTLEQARANMNVIARRLEQQYPDSNTGMGVNVVSLQEQIAGKIRMSLLVLFGAVCLVLLIACANVANLLLARSTIRQKEIAIRTAVGARRPRLIRQMLTESLLLSLLGSGFGLALAYWSVKFLVAIGPDSIHRVREISIDWRVLGFALLVALMTGMIFGLAPALQATKANLNQWLKEGSGRATMNPVRSRMHNLLVIFEVAMALLLLIGAGLMIKSFSRLQQVKPGFNPENVMTADLTLPRRRYRDGYEVIALIQQILNRIAGLPGVQSASATHALPLSGDNNTFAVFIEGRTLPRGEYTSADYRSISPDYFRTMGIPILRGRQFTDRDVVGTHGVVIVSETMAKRFFPNEDPMGKRFSIADGRGLEMLEIVGVAGDVRHFGLDHELTAEMYVPILQRLWPNITLVIRGASDPLGLSAAIRNEVRQVDKDQTFTNIRTMDQILSHSVSQRRFNMLLLSIFAAVAITMSIVGIYGVMSFSVTQRTHEIGVRIALGAQAGNVLRMVMWRGMSLALIGVALGLAAALALSRVMKNLLFEVSPTDSSTFALITLLLVAVALIASYIPARRATMVDPLFALRCE
jgi:putative ABC transport system permease protein